MTKLTLEQQELLFANDCKLINLRYEYLRRAQRHKSECRTGAVQTAYFSHFA